MNDSPSQNLGEENRLYDAFSRLNNELAAMQRELAKKNAELKVAHEEMEERVRERTRDLQEAKDEAERANAAKSAFLSQMSHELRTPLNSILGFAQIMEIDSPSAKQTERLGYILQAGHQLLRMIDNLLDTTRAESDRLPLSATQTPQKESEND